MAARELVELCGVFVLWGICCVEYLLCGVFVV